MHDRIGFFVGLIVLCQSSLLWADGAPRPIKVEKRFKIGDFVIEQLVPGPRGEPGIRFGREADGGTVFEAFNPDGGFIGDGCIGKDGKFLAYAIGGGSAGHECVLMVRNSSGEYEEVPFDFVDSMVAALKDAGLIPMEAKGCHEYASPVAIENGELILRLKGNYAKDGIQNPYPAAVFVFSLAEKKLSVRRN